MTSMRSSSSQDAIRRGSSINSAATSDQLVAEQEREHVVAVLALRGRGVNLDPVMEPEHPQGSVAVPDDRVERAQQGASDDPAPQTRLGMEVVAASTSSSLRASCSGNAGRASASAGINRSRRS